MAGRGTDIILGGNRRDDGLGHAARQVRHAPRRAAGRMERRSSTRSKQREKMKAEGPGGRRARRPAHHRHRAARSPPHRLAAPRPLRSPGRPRQQPLLPVARRRPDADLRRRVGQEHAHPARHARRRGDRKPDGQPPHRRRPEEGRRAQLRRPQEPARIRRGDGRAAEAGLRLSASGFWTAATAASCHPGDDRPSRSTSSSTQFLEPRLRRRAFAACAGSVLACRARCQAISAAWTSTKPSSSPSDEAERAWPKAQVLDAIEENLPGRETKTRANGTGKRWPRWPTRRWGLNLRDRDLKKIGRDHVGEYLIEKAHEVDRQGRSVRGHDATWKTTFGMRTACGWAAPQVRRRARPGRSQDAASRRVQAAASRSKAERRLRPEGSRISGAGRPLPLHHAATRASRRGSTARTSSPGPASGSSADLDRRRPQEQAARRNSRAARRAQPEAQQARPKRRIAEVRQRVDRAVRRGRRRPQRLGAVTGHNGKLDSLAELAASNRCNYRAHERRARRARSRAARAAAAAARSKIASAPRCGGWSGCCSCRFSTRLERPPARMDHLRSSVGLRGYAQVDPKVEYKREGMRTVRADVELDRRPGDRPDLPDGAARRRFRRLAPGSKRHAIHDEAPAATEDQRSQQQAQSPAPKPMTSSSRSATAATASAATIPAPAAAARNTRTAACGKRRRHESPEY